MVADVPCPLDRVAEVHREEEAGLGADIVLFPPHPGPAPGAERRFLEATGAFVDWLLRSRHVPVSSLAMPGRVQVTSTHVDVVLALEQLNLAVRVAGLDRDPGWVPSLGRIVLFHFVGGGS